MRCTSPKKVSFDINGNITFSQKKAEKGLIPFTIPCNQCIACQLEYSAQWAIRCLHESYMTPKDQTNLFITLTYSDKNLPGPILVKNDFDRFLERVKDNYGYRTVYACGEYGSKTKRPHWHALLFGFTLPDLKIYSQNKHGNNLYTSQELDRLWPYNDVVLPNKLGFIDYGSAAYVARYTNKALVHGTKQELHQQNLQPISIKTRGLGKTYLEKYYQDIFKTGTVIEDGRRHPIPRYYERWFQNNHPLEYEDYLLNVKLPLSSYMSTLSDQQYEKWLTVSQKEGVQITKNEINYKRLLTKNKRDSTKQRRLNESRH